MTTSATVQNGVSGRPENGAEDLQVVIDRIRRLMDDDLPEGWRATLNRVMDVLRDMGEKPTDELSVLRLMHSLTNSKHYYDLMIEFEVGSQRIPAGIDIYPAGDWRERIDLPTPRVELKADLAFVLDARTSTRFYSGKQIELQTMSDLLFWSAGERPPRRAYGKFEFPIRIFPSAGGFGTFDIHLIALNVEGLKPGRYIYHPGQHELLFDEYGDPRLRLAQGTFGAEWMQYAPAVLAFVHDIRRADWKYGPRSYRYIHVDLGIVTEAIYLVATALGLGGCAIAAFDDDTLNDLVRADGRDRFVSLLFSLGYAAQGGE